VNNRIRLCNSCTGIRHTPPQIRLPMIQWMKPSRDRYLSMSLLLITPQTIQLACFQRNKDTLEMHSNVAGTGKAGAKVVAGFDAQLSVENTLRETERVLQRPLMAASEIPLFDFPRKVVVRRKTRGMQGEVRNCRAAQPAPWFDTACPCF
jgi:hypothetical protein